jgi:hypothetical protein
VILGRALNTAAWPLWRDGRKSWERWRSRRGGASSSSLAGSRGPTHCWSWAGSRRRGPSSTPSAPPPRSTVSPCSCGGRRCIGPSARPWRDASTQRRRTRALRARWVSGWSKRTPRSPSGCRW